MTNKLSISIIIPTHNRRLLLERLLASLLNQKLDASAYEIIVVHNYTDDGSEEAIEKITHSSRVSVHYYKKQYRGPAASRSFGASVAKGEVIAFIDDDCEATPDWLAAALAQFSSNPTLGLLQGKTTPHPRQKRHLLEKTILIDKPSIFFETCNIFYRKSVYDAVGGFSDDFIDKFYGEDTDLGWKVKLAGYPCHFSEDAEVYHEVFKVSYWRWLKEPLFFVNLPYLVGKVEPLRAHMYRRYFLSADTCFFYGVLLGLLLSPLHMGFIFLSTPYFGHRYISANHMPNPMLRLARIGFGLPRALFMCWALMKGSIKARRVLL